MADILGGLVGILIGVLLFRPRYIPPLPIPQIADVRPPSTAELTAGVVEDWEEVERHG